MKTDTSSLTEPPARIARVPSDLWVWRSSGEIGRWLPEAVLGNLRYNQPAVEPFVESGSQAALAQGWRADVPRESDEKKLRAYLADAKGLVHSVDRWSDGFQAAVADAAAQRSGRHVILFVRDSALRLADLLATRPKLPPIAALVERDRTAAGRLGRLQLALSRAQQPVRWVALDDLAADGSASAAAWRELWAFVGNVAPDTTLQSAWRERLAEDARRVAAAPDAHWQALLRREALWAGSPEMPPACLTPVERAPAGQAALFPLVRFDRLPPVVREGESLRLSGVVVPAGAPLPDRRLLLRQGERRHRLGWDQPSPAVAARLPDQPAAAHSRFKPMAIRASRRQPAAVLYRADDQATPVPVAEIAFEPIGAEAMEGIYLAPWSIGYQPIPKVACTSIKESLFRAMVGLPFSAALSEGADHIHRYFDLRTRDVSAAAFRFTVVRDPIKRFLSAFSNRVLHHKELSKDYVERLRLDPPLDLASFVFDPDLARFVDQFESYRRIPTIDHHFRPISEISAPLTAFDKVYPFEALNDLMTDLQQRTGVSMSLPHSQRGGPKLQVKDLSARVFNKLVDIFAADYAMLDGLYSPAALR